eukprot:TRINITY_DN1950_c0_g1_i2.p1 TRINITY_DN1950_c0_g1~~TRINITY_DN1950_c0_g1_i2.p1  ORF type:complete len:552 (-),score=102.49 TRINITY_DN1950_c0_g1_i2:108-1763(-)
MVQPYYGVFYHLCNIACAVLPLLKTDQLQVFLDATSSECEAGDVSQASSVPFYVWHIPAECPFLLPQLLLHIATGSQHCIFGRYFDNCVVMWREEDSAITPTADSLLSCIVTTATGLPTTPNRYNFTLWFACAATYLIMWHYLTHPRVELFATAAAAAFLRDVVVCSASDPAVREAFTRGTIDPGMYGEYFSWFFEHFKLQPRDDRKPLITCVCGHPKVSETCTSTEKMKAEEKAETMFLLMLEQFCVQYGKHDTVLAETRRLLSRTFARASYRLVVPQSVLNSGSGGCAWCHAVVDKMLLCGGCHTEQYCCTNCQRAHWTYHKDACSRVKAQPPTPAMPPAPPAQPAQPAQPEPGDAEPKMKKLKPKVRTTKVKASHSCAFCGRVGETLGHCASCNSVWYCGSQCQRSHWRTHRATCKRLQGTKITVHFEYHSPSKNGQTHTCAFFSPAFPEACLRQLRPDEVVIPMQTVRVQYDYPLPQPVVFQETAASAAGFTRRELLALICARYQQLYSERKGGGVPLEQLCITAVVQAHAGRNLFKLRVGTLSGGD